MTPIKKIYTYRFHDCIALSISGAKETVYISSSMAMELGEILINASKDIETKSFTDSQFFSRNIEENGRMTDSAGEPL